MPRDHDQFKISWIRAFLAVQRTGSFTAAAGEIQRTQSRVSALVAEFEHYLGVDLFIRGNVPVRLTEQGRELLPYARSIVDQVDEAAAAVSAKTGVVRGRVTVCGFPGATVFFLAPAIKRFRDRYEQADVALWDSTPPPEVAVSHGLVDFAVVAGFEQRPSVTRVPLFDEPIVGLVPSDHPAAGDEWVDPDIFAGETVIMTGSIPDGHLAAGDVLTSVGVHPAHRYLVGFEPTTVPALVGAGLGIGIMPMLAARLLDTGGRVRLVRLRGPEFRRHAYVLSNRNRRYPLVAQRFLESVCEAPLPDGVDPVDRGRWSGGPRRRRPE